MNKDLDAMCRALDALATAITTGWTGNQTFCEAWGWNCATVTRHDMAAIPLKLANDIRSTNIDSLPENLVDLVKDYPRRLQHMQAQTIPQFWGSNNGQAVSAFIATMESVRLSLIPLLGWQAIPDNKTMPGHIARKLRSIQAEIDDLAPKKEELANQLSDIRKAHESAESLPIDLQALQEARNRVNKLAEEATASTNTAKQNSEQSSAFTSEIKAKHEEAQKLVNQCEEAYRITTTKGLAAAFDNRASQLSTSMWIWVFGLLISLVAGAYLGAKRIELLSIAIQTQNPEWGVIWMHIILSVLSIGGPLWFAWLATKQIGQRFRLAEDYGFKASVAKAYEGYRKEAARLDEAFEARLFSSALSRLEEAPLRLVNHSDHGSPWHEFIASEAFQKALDLIPDLKNSFIEFAKKGALLIQQNNSQTPDSTQEKTTK